MPVNGNLNILIVDDEPLACRRLQVLCHRIESIAHVAVAASGTAALQHINDNLPDIVLLDIDMPDISGVEIADHCQQMESAPKVIFTTAHSRYAVQAFRLEAVDYLLKPVKEVLLIEALARAGEKLQRENRKAAPDHSLWVRDGETSLQIRSADIERIEAERDYMRLCLPGCSYLIHESMYSLIKKLPPDMFVRVHRSAMVRRDMIGEIRRKGRRQYAILIDGNQVPIGPRYADAVVTVAR
ncbi:LytR/AlgR family response regulator transcription factor [Parasphingorhabdus halotolerans]|uniref:Response regulator transcription factor n=1 Tax=Parasphingorhabdus halotolerans TaxID=2725558 RepID=A0A6H2DPT1_9SPHN|nr:LytTR family DNA-binding domain-containing protein [Parasphingorhabdus halotolerans]QJB70344.1 response regulator transcription factor [Parasphingorhabdus halotolerans]